MKKIIFNFMICLFVAGCADMPARPAIAAPPSVTQIQGQCFASYQKFLEQVSCIKSSIARYSYAQPNSYVQEYEATMQSLSAKVKKSRISDDDARLQLTQALNRLCQQQQQEFQQQAGLASQRNTETDEILKRNSSPSLEFHPIVPPSIHRPTNTNCYSSGNQVNCTTY